MKINFCVSIVWNVGLKKLLDVGFLLDLYFYKPLEPFKCTHAYDIALQGQEIELCTAKHRRGKNWMEDRLQKRAWRRVKKDGGRHGSTAVSLSAPSSVVRVRHSLISSYDDGDKVIKADVGRRDRTRCHCRFTFKIGRQQEVSC